MSEQVCLDCGTHEAAGAYCTRCLGRNVQLQKAGKGRPKSTRAALKTAKPGGRRYPATQRP